MNQTFDDLSRGLAQASSRRQALRLIVGSVAASLTSACINPLTPTKTQTGFQRCANLGSLYCNSYSIPQTLADGVSGACCLSPSASVGYLCAFGSNYVAAGCFGTLEQARQACPKAVSIVRCTS